MLACSVEERLSVSDALAGLLELPTPELPTTFVTDENNDVTVRAVVVHAARGPALPNVTGCYSTLDVCM